MNAGIWIAFPVLLFAGVAQADLRPCGLDGSVRERIADCGLAMTDICEGPRPALLAQDKVCSVAILKAEDGLFSWRLVSRTRQGKDIWRDEKTGLIWSARFDKPVAWKAAEAVCDLARNGNLDITANLAMGFRVPTDADFKTADLHGVGAVLPGIPKTNYWTANSDAQGLHIAVFSHEGYRYAYARTAAAKSLYSVRCVSASSIEPSTVEGGFKERGESETTRKSSTGGGHETTD